MKNKISLKKIVIHLVLILVCIFSVFPVYWMIVSSFKTGTEIFNYSLLPSSFSLENYKIAIESIPVVRMLLNSLIVSLGTGLAQLLVSILFAYAFIRWNFRGKSAIFALVSLAWLIPIQAIMLPNYVEIVNMGLKNTLVGIILPNLCSVLANIRIYQAFNSFPKSLLDAARLDGSNDGQLLFDIILPNLKSHIASLGIILVISTWNEYLWPMIIASDMHSAPIQIGLRSFLSPDGQMWGPAMAAATLSVLPILLIYIFMSRDIVNSFMKGGIK